MPRVARSVSIAAGAGLPAPAVTAGIDTNRIRIIMASAQRKPDSNPMEAGFESDWSGSFGMKRRQRR